ncbi:hypothetical protein AB1Y20_009428 [Prymnesium parvum]|uniref:U-box domain-containing protein n=1 Tax=Prymnesium parvum TaxID=97485 RepID=A0AB34K4K2_PRYPA
MAARGARSKMASASELAVWIATGVLCAGAYVRHGLLMAGMYWLSTACLCTIDPSLQSLQLLNLAAVVCDLSFELHRLYALVSNRPLLMIVILVASLLVEWLLERHEEEDAQADHSPRGTISGMARLGRSVGRMLLPAVMGVLIACIGWLMLTAALMHPSFPTWLVHSPFVETVEYLLGARSECVSSSDCIYLTGSQHQHRVHGVYVRSPRTCAGKPVYRQRGGEGLFLHSPAHENQWNVGPDLCDNSPRNKWMELYSPASTAAEIGNGTWFEYTDEGGWLRNTAVRVSPCTNAPSATSAESCVQISGSSRDDAQYMQMQYFDSERRPGCNGNGKPVYLSVKVDEEEGVAPYLYSPARRNSWLVGADPCRANGWMEVRSSAESAAHIQAGASGPWQEYNGHGWVRALSIRALAHCGGADDCLYISGSHHQQHTHGVYKKTSMQCDGKPVYLQYNGHSPHEDNGGDGEHRRLYLYSPTGRESWMVGRDACRPSGWLEIHSSVHLVEGIEGAWREHVPGGSWAANPSIKLQLNALQDSFVSFSQHPDGRINDIDGVLWRLTSLISSMPPSVPIDDDDLDDGLDGELAGRRDDERRGEGTEGDVAPRGETQSSQRDVAALRAEATRLPQDEEPSRSTGESTDELEWTSYPAIPPSRDDLKLSEEGQSMEGAHPAADEATDSLAGGLKRNRDAARGATPSSLSASAGHGGASDAGEVARAAKGGGEARKAHAEGGGEVVLDAAEDGRRGAAPRGEAELDDEGAKESLCLDLVVEPSLEGGRLLALERARTPARAKVVEKLRADGWHFRWVRPGHYASPHARQWLTQKFWHASRLYTMTVHGEGRSLSRAQRKGLQQQQLAADSAAEIGLGLRGWRKFLFRAEDFEGLRQVCESAGLRLDNVHLLTAVQQQTIPLSNLRLWPACLRLFLERHAQLLLAASVGLFLVAAQLGRKWRERSRRRHAERERQERAARKQAEAQERKERRGEQLQAAAKAKAKKEKEEAARREVARERAARELSDARARKESRKAEERARRGAAQHERASSGRSEGEPSPKGAAGGGERCAEAAEEERAARETAAAAAAEREAMAARVKAEEEKARREAEEAAAREAARLEMKEAARRAEEAARRKAAEEAAKREAEEEAAKREAEEAAKREAEEKARREAEARDAEKARKEVARAREAEAKARRVADGKARREAKPRAREAEPPPRKTAGRHSPSARAPSPATPQLSSRSTAGSPHEAAALSTLSANAPPWRSRALEPRQHSLGADELGGKDDFSLLEPSVAERAALSVLDDFGDFDLDDARDELAGVVNGGPRGGALGGNGLAGVKASELGQLPIGRNGAANTRGFALPRGLPPSPAVGVPHELLCPISHELMSDPVLAADGHAYERSCIEEWLTRQRTSPLTGEPLPTTNLLPCHTLKNMAAAYLNTQPRH